VQKRVGEVTVASLLVTPNPCLSFRTLSQEVRVCVITNYKCKIIWEKDRKQETKIMCDDHMATTKIAIKLTS
jgi:hypothetical protein